METIDNINELISIESEEQAHFKKQAEKLAKLTFLLARACEVKEQQFIQQYNLTNAEFRCMRFLKKTESVSVKEIADQMNLTPGRITHILTSLEEKEYVVREIDTHDRRNIKVRLTANALPYIENVINKHNELHERVLANIPFEQRDFVLKAIKEVYDSINDWSESVKT